jgi:hypothetical protein
VLGFISAGVGCFGGFSVGISAFSLDGSMYSHTLLFSAVPYMTKNHWIQSDGLLRMILAFNSLVVVIFRI